MIRELRVDLISLNVEGFYSLPLAYLENTIRCDRQLDRNVDLRTHEVVVRERPGRTGYPRTVGGAWNDALVRGQVARAPGRVARAAIRTATARLDIPARKIQARLVALRSRIQLRKPDVCGFSCNIWNVEETLDLARSLKSSLPGTLIVLGGQEVSGSGEDLLAAWPWVDVLVDGEGEHSFCELLRRLLRDRPRTPDRVDLAGIHTHRHGHTVCGAPAPLIEPLDSIPSPYLPGPGRPVPVPVLRAAAAARRRW